VELQVVAEGGQAREEGFQMPRRRRRRHRHGRPRGGVPLIGAATRATPT
jgi:hypothetical protein